MIDVPTTIPPTGDREKWEPLREFVRHLHYYGFPPDERMASRVEADVEEVIDLARAAMGATDDQRA